MMNRIGLGLRRQDLRIGAIGLALALSAFTAPPSEASPFGLASHWHAAQVLPVVEVQARYHGRREHRPVRRGGNNNGALVAGALVGAAILGGVIVAQLEAERRERRRRAQYDEIYPTDHYDGRPIYYYGPPRRVYRPAPRHYVDDGHYGYGQPRVYYHQPRRNRSCLVNTPERENPYTYVPC